MCRCTQTSTALVSGKIDYSSMVHTMYVHQNDDGLLILGVSGSCRSPVDQLNHADFKDSDRVDAKFSVQSMIDNEQG